MAVDEAKLEQFMGQVVSDWAATAGSALAFIGDRLRLYRALARIQPATPAELAGETGTSERYVREWLLCQAAGGYVTYADGRFGMTEEQAAALADPDSPVSMLGGFQITNAVFADLGHVLERFRSGDGMGWGEHHHDLFEGTERLFAPGYRRDLVPSWLPALDGVVRKLEAGARVADVGCGHGISTLVMAEAYPASSFVGYDAHDGSVRTARARAEAAGIGNAAFETAGATEYDGGEFDLVCFFDALHDMGDPAAAVRHARGALAPGGTIMAVEPFAGDRPEDNFNPVGRLFYAASTMVCVPNSLAAEGVALGAQAGTERTRQVFEEAGCASFRRAAETPFNLVFEARG